MNRNLKQYIKRKEEDLRWAKDEVTDAKREVTLAKRHLEDAMSNEVLRSGLLTKVKWTKPEVRSNIYYADVNTDKAAQRLVKFYDGTQNRKLHLQGRKSRPSVVLDLGQDNTLRLVFVQPKKLKGFLHVNNIPEAQLT